MYAMDLKYVYVLIIALIFIWAMVSAFLTKKISRCVNILVMFVAVYGIAKYTVLGRTPTDIHRFLMFAIGTNEFVREMVMNAFLYVPLGLTLTNVVQKYWLSVLIGCLLSISIESWQYFAGTGLAQGTDVICNTLGIMAGGISFILSQWYRKKRGQKDK